MSARWSWLALFAVTASLYARGVHTIAGYGTYGGDGGPATAALLSPAAAAIDADGTIYVSDPINDRIRKIAPSGTITTVIGQGYSAFSGDEGPATAAVMSKASSIALDSAGNLYFTDDENLRIREVTKSGTVHTLAGNGGCDTVTLGMVATQAPLCDVDSVAIDAQGRVLFGSGGQLWRITATGTLALVAGTGGFASSGDNGPATSAEIGFPASVVVDANGDIYLADLYNFVVREITPDQKIHTMLTITDPTASTISLALEPNGTLDYAIGTNDIYRLSNGTSSIIATVPPPHDASNLAIGRDGVVYASSTSSDRLLRINGATTTVIAGAYPFDLEPLPQPARNVRLHLDPVHGGIAVDSAGNVYFPELDNDLVQRIDKLSPDGTLSRLNTPATLPNTNIDFTAGALAIGPNGSLYFATFSQVYRVDSHGNTTLIAGTTSLSAPLGDGGSATAAKISPSGLAFDPNGNLYIAEAFESRVRKVTPNGIITTFAGTGEDGYNGDHGLAVNARLASPVDVEVDTAGNVYIADVAAAVVRKVATNGIITTVAGNGTHGFSGDGGQATNAQLSGPASIAIDSDGNLYIADRNQAAAVFIPIPDNNSIREVRADGTITTLYGGLSGYNGEGIASSRAAAGGPSAIAVDARGNLYVAESEGQRIRELPADGSRRRSVRH